MPSKNSTFVKDNESLYSRLSPTPTGVAFGLRSVGRIELPPGAQTPARTINFVHVVWSIGGTGWARIDPFPPDHTAAFLPGAKHCLLAGEEPWRYRWITLDGPAAAIVVSGLGLGIAPVPSGTCPEALFDELEEAVLAIGPESEVRASAAAYGLLAEISCARERQTPATGWSTWAEGIRELIAANLDDPEIGVAEIADIAGMDRSILTNRFKQAAGIPPKEYLTALRLQRAMTLLRTTEDSVAEVAGQCGFSCANYFIKAFRKRIGTTPLRYRRRAV
jgi:AraC-like DNA-binding protein